MADRPSFLKRKREQDRREKRKAKAERKVQRRAEAAKEAQQGGVGPDGQPIAADPAAEPEPLPQ